MHTKASASYFAYVVIGGLGILFAIITIALARPLLFPEQCHTDTECAEMHGGNGDPE